MTATQRMIVTGRVQGVGYRNWAVNRARALGVTGWVRNTHGGGVELVASGEDEAVGALVEALRQGPEMARVDHIEVLAAQDAKLKGFTKRLGT
ncbi:acylphosphatase [Sphingomonas sp. UYAg733]